MPRAPSWEADSAHARSTSPAASPFVTPPPLGPSGSTGPVRAGDCPRPGWADTAIEVRIASFVRGASGRHAAQFKRRCKLPIFVEGRMAGPGQKLDRDMVGAATVMLRQARGNVGCGAMEDEI